MAKKLLNWNFSNGAYSVNIGVSSTDHLDLKPDKQFYSDTKPLNQVGALIFVNNTYYMEQQDWIKNIDRATTINAAFKNEYGSTCLF